MSPPPRSERCRRWQTHNLQVKVNCALLCLFLLGPLMWLLNGVTSIISFIQPFRGGTVLPPRCLLCCCGGESLPPPPHTAPQDKYMSNVTAWTHSQQRPFSSDLVSAQLYLQSCDQLNSSHKFVSWPQLRWACVWLAGQLVVRGHWIVKIQISFMFHRKKKT